jgi:anion-transporting  ArsA/GET3 family ATPase
MAVADLLDARLVLVTGKGGTGKTTFATALALLSATRGQRTLLVEVDNQRPSTTALLGVVPGHEPVEARPNLWTTNARFSASLSHFVEQMVPVRRVVRLVLENRIVGRFLDFTPGSRELVVLARIAGLAKRFDRVIVDMPASGHAFSLLDIVRSARGLFRTGPVRKLAEELGRLLADPSTRLAFVALPEEMVVTETTETIARMRAASLVGGEPVVFLNRATLPSLVDAERALIAQISSADLPPRLAEFALAGRWEDELEQATARARDRLAASFPSPPVLVPPAAARVPPARVVEAVAVTLGRLVVVTRRDLQWT